MDSSLSKQVQELNRIISQQSEEIKVLQKLNEDLQRTQFADELILDQFEKELIGYLNSNEQLTQQVIDLRAQIEFQDQKINGLMEIIEKQNQQINELKKRMETEQTNSKKRVETLETEFKVRIQNQETKLKRRIETQETEFLKEQTKSKKRVETLEAEQAKQKKRVETLEKTIETQETEQTNLKKTIETQETEMQAMKSWMMNLQQKMYDDASDLLIKQNNSRIIGDFAINLGDKLLIIDELINKRPRESKLEKIATKTWERLSISEDLKIKDIILSIRGLKDQRLKLAHSIYEEKKGVSQSDLFKLLTGTNVNKQQINELIRICNILTFQNESLVGKANISFLTSEYRKQ